MTTPTDQTKLDAPKPASKPKADKTPAPSQVRGPHNRITQEQAERAVATYRAGQPKQPGERPYVLESSNLEAELNRQRDDALSELEAIESAVLDIQTRQNRDKAAIDSRAEAEISGRRDRAKDLQRIVEMTGRALDLPPAPALTPGSVMYFGTSAADEDNQP